MVRHRLVQSGLVAGALSVIAGAHTLAADMQATHPDFTGVWTMYLEPGQSIFSAFGGPPAKLPFTPEGQKRRDEYNKLLGPEQANPGAYCVDYGMPMMMEQAGGYPIEFIQKPDQLTIIYEVEGEMRRVYLGGRSVPESKRLPTRQGYSTGQWEGNVLVVETSDLSDGEDQAHPHSDQARIVERFSLGRSAKGTRVVSYEMTLTDPVYYTQPVNVSKKWEEMKDGFIISYRCPDEFWQELRDKRREQLRSGKPADARMSDIYKARELKE
ncbi:MAG: hypothetical protein RL030_951 [Pseudomonadota bacterium]